MSILIWLICVGVYITIGAFLKEILGWVDDDSDSAMICFWPVIVPVMIFVAMVRQFIKAGEKLAKIIKNIRRKNK